MNVGIITMHAARNYGAVLQTYALQEEIRRMGFAAEIIDYRRSNQTELGYLFDINKNYKNNLIRKVMFFSKTFFPKIRSSHIFSDFRKRKLYLSEKTFVGPNPEEHFPVYDVYCVGSDQVWNPNANNGFDANYFLEKVQGKKISYASSIGTDELSDNDLQYIKVHTGDFSYISVREISSVYLLRKVGIECVNVIDPVFLLSPNEWLNFAELRARDKYLLVYYFGNAEKILLRAKKIADSRNLKIVRISVGYERYHGDQFVERFITPEQFVGLFANAEAVITNSFHGTAFSIIFKKQVYIHPVSDKNTRFESIMKLFNLQQRNIRNMDDSSMLKLPDINYDSVSDILHEKIELSEAYLRKALNAKK